MLLIGVPCLSHAAGLDEAKAAARVRDYARMAAVLEPLAAKGDAEAQYQLGGLYRSGLGVTKNEAIAVEWIRRAALQGHANAQHTLAVMYEQGAGTPVNKPEALRWLRAAAAQGHALAKAALSSTAREPDADPGESLRRAAARGQLDDVRGLLSRGVSVDIADDSGRTPLIEAAANGHAAVIDALLRHGADVRARDRYGDTALHVAVREGNSLAVDGLLAAGADVNAADANGNTPLMAAAIKGHQAIAARLIAQRCDIHAKNKSGQTAIVLANRNQHQAIVATLVSHGAKLPEPQGEIRSVRPKPAEPRNEGRGSPPLNLAALAHCCGVSLLRVGGGRDHHALRFRGGLGDAVDDSIYGIRAPQRSSRSANHLDSVDVLDRYVQRVPINTAKKLAVFAAAINQDLHFVVKYVAESARAQLPVMVVSLGHVEPRHCA